MHSSMNFHKVYMHVSSRSRNNMAGPPETSWFPLPVSTPRVTTTLTANTIVPPAFDPYVKATISSAFFCVYLLSFNILFMIFIHVDCSYSLFILIPVWKYNLFSILWLINILVVSNLLFQHISFGTQRYTFCGVCSVFKRKVLSCLAKTLS